MAGIDKTYIETKEEYLQARQWWINNYDKMIDELGYAIWLHPFSVFYECASKITPEFLTENKGDCESPLGVLWNTFTEEDRFLMAYCHIPFVRDRLKVQYPNTNININKPFLNDQQAKRYFDTVINRENLQIKYFADITRFNWREDGVSLLKPLTNTSYCVLVMDEFDSDRIYEKGYSCEFKNLKKIVVAFTEINDNGKVNDVNQITLWNRSGFKSLGDGDE